MKTRPLCSVCLLLIMIQVFLLIVTSGQSFLKIPASSVFLEKEGKTIRITGQVYQKEITSKNQILYLKNNSVYDSKIIVYDQFFTEVSIGETISLSGTVNLFEEARNPGNFNQALYYARQQLYGFIWCEEVYDVTGTPNNFWEFLYQFKERWKEKLIKYTGKENGDVLYAMLLGEKSGMDVELKELYQVNGISHVLAISGLHISFVGLGIYKLIKKTGAGYVVSGFAAISLLSIYVAMIGVSVSVLRAFIMLVFRIGADITGRVYDMLTALMVSAAITVLYEPLYLTDAGFYMSYGAILGILFVLPAIQKHFTWKRISGLLASVSINIMLFPVLLYFYFEFPTYSVLWNLMIIPLMSFVLGFGMIGSLFLVFFAPIGKLLLWCCGWILEFFKWVSVFGSRLPCARIVLGQPDIWQIAIYYLILGCVLLYLWKHKMCKKRVWLLLAVALCVVSYRPHRDLQITMLDVGQGDGIYIKGPNGIDYMIDGGSSDVEQIGKYRMEPFLKSQGVGTLEYVFLTHGDGDHYSGIVEMLQRQRVGIRMKRLVLPVNYKQDENLTEVKRVAEQNRTKVYSINSGESLEEDELKITCLQPSEEEQHLVGNEGSLVLSISYKRFSMLCTGDVELDGEKTLVNHIKEEPYDVLKVGHHGSKNATSVELLEKIKPTVALISAGEGNRYGHPHKETIKRLKKIGCQIYQTSKKGAITIRSEGNSLTISSVPFRL